MLKVLLMVDRNNMSDYSIFIRGNKINLCPLRKDDFSVIYHWHNDVHIVKYSLNMFVRPTTKEDAEKFIQDSNNSKIITFGIQKGKQLIGYAGLSNINQINKSAEYFILIGEKKYWHKGIGLEVTKLITAYGFQSLNLHRIELSVSIVNTFAIKLYKKSGFLEEGCKKDACFRDGQYHDKLLFAKLSSLK